MRHSITIGPSAAQIINADGRVSPLPKQPTHRARCSCGWRSAEYATAGEAMAVGTTHRKLASRADADTDLPASLGEPEPLI